MARRAMLVGLALVALYAAVAVATLRLAATPLRPLFDGFGVHSPYAWVNPPEGFEAGNQAADDAELDALFLPSGSQPIQTATGDGQITVSMAEGSIPPRGSDQAATLRMVPVDATTLGDLPDGLRAEGNAYLVTFTYKPSGVALATLARPANVAMTGAERADALLFSTDGAGWKADPKALPLATTHGLNAPLSRAGYYLVASRGPPRAGGSDGVWSGPAPYLPLILVPIVLVVLAGRRSRQAVPAARPRGRRATTGRARSKRSKRSRRRR